MYVCVCVGGRLFSWPTLSPLKPTYPIPLKNVNSEMPFPASGYILSAKTSASGYFTFELETVEYIARVSGTRA